MFKFTDDEINHLKEMRAITTDSDGNEVLVGLTLEETEKYMAHSRAFLSRDRDFENRELYLKLREKHEKARLEVIGSEIYIRNENPSKH